MFSLLKNLFFNIFSLFFSRMFQCLVQIFVLGPEISHGGPAWDPDVHFSCTIVISSDSFMTGMLTTAYLYSVCNIIKPTMIQLQVIKFESFINLYLPHAAADWCLKVTSATKQ